MKDKYNIYLQELRGDIAALSDAIEAKEPDSTYWIAKLIRRATDLRRDLQEDAQQPTR